jgi:dTDP-4-dehydrorhamnose reductase
MLGHDVVAALAGADVTALTRVDLDLTDSGAVADAVSGHDVVVNAAAWTDVDGAERDEAAATAVNGTAVAGLAEACAKTGAVLLHVSTDYVFSGEATHPYAEDAPTSPINAYGRSKLVGERAVLAYPKGYVVRTAWLYGRHGRNFVTTLLRRASERETFDVVNDQRGQPTWSYALAERLVELGRAARAGRAVPGPYHGTASGETTWYGLARAVFEGAGLDPNRIRPITSSGYPSPAKRPAYSVLGHARWAQAGLPTMRGWRDLLDQALPDLLTTVPLHPAANEVAP